ncbi:hypothetical protein B0A48_12881 [Cryoendolithus antarcticus]|uniref:Oxidoreductase-like domain-containing protein n=1 Tax=Cryoendolithus antarcticus TaxID=1507870 RepID=A0A1V8SQ82_9PEZI|nr:hypothetical protein B0A48_12881 [Cryoendolithus antarcticus]
MYSKDQIRACAISTERIVAQAVKASAIPIETVDLYGSISRCAMSFHRIEHFGAVLEISTLKSLVLFVTSNEKLEDGGCHIDHSHIISALLSQLSRLERLDLRWCNARRTDLTGADLVDRLFFADVAPLSFTSLNGLSLKGIYTTSTNLLTFLQRHVQLRILCLERVKLLDGTFDPIFGHMSDIMELDSFYMCDLSHASEFARLQFIGVVGRNLYGHGGPPTRVRREGVHARERLQYKIITGRVRGDGRNQRYYRDVKDRFGYKTDPLDTPLLPKRPQAPVSPSPVVPEALIDSDKEDRIVKARVVFGSRLASPVERWDAIKRASTNIAGVLVPPRPEEPDNCCMSGCVNCVWDLFRDELEEWAAKKAEAREKMAAQRGSEAAVSMENDGGGSNTNWEMSGEDSEKADLFEGIPVGIRAFMETEKRLKMLQKQQEQAQGV